MNAGQPLHVSDLSLLDHPECREVNADPAGTSWKICLFMECKEDKNDVLKGVSAKRQASLYWTLLYKEDTIMIMSVRPIM